MILISSWKRSNSLKKSSRSCCRNWNRKKWKTSRWDSRSNSL